MKEPLKIEEQSDLSWVEEELAGISNSTPACIEADAVENM